MTRHFSTCFIVRLGTREAIRCSFGGISEDELLWEKIIGRNSTIPYEV